MRVLLIGYGMVGSRFADDLVARRPDARVTVLGKEDAAPYNRVLLSSVVAGKSDASMLTLPTEAHPRIDVRQGVRALSVNRGERTVTDSTGEVHLYDRLVFATGSAARIPNIHGIATDLGLVPGVSVLKDLADAEQIVAQIPRARRAIVLGAGVLGLEVATGLAGRGLSVTLVHHHGRLMERQLGDAASNVAEGSLGRLGVSVITDASVTRITERRGVLTAVELSNGTEILADMLIMCAGTITESALARNAGLPCDRGILVGDDLASPVDPKVFAIGDCAQPPAGGTGLVAQGWDQAARLVNAWSVNADSQPVVAPQRRGSKGADEMDTDLTNVVRVKAPGLDVVTMGLSGKFDHGARELRAVRMSDPSIGRFVEVVVSHGLLVGATVVGDKVAAAELSAMYTRMIPVPSDPAHLIIRPLAGAVTTAATSVEDMGDDHPVCQCNSVSKGAIVAAVHDGCTTTDDIARATRASTGCGDCRSLVGDIIRTCAVADLAEVSTESRPADQFAATKVPALAGRTKG
ncbi:FAD-dependent oxidoreductase [Demequina oxidasica]|uniref:FAD-dependent oxidoreductase n=1 Tax=Demequina oxidasica TaxID=676199 RepID=UPI00078497BE|nr:FAD-dependent oxidoreductase [Demequina oxidasica]